MSPKGGGPSQWHRSHRNGHDADLIFFALDEDGNPAPTPDGMRQFDAHGVSEGEPRLRFDTCRNWALVRALLEDPSVRVTHIFVYQPLAERLLRYAIDHEEPESLIARA